MGNDIFGENMVVFIYRAEIATCMDKLIDLAPPVKYREVGLYGEQIFDISVGVNLPMRMIVARKRID